MRIYTNIFLNEDIRTASQHKSYTEKSDAIKALRENFDNTLKCLEDDGYEPEVVEFKDYGDYTIQYGNGLGYYGMTITTEI